MLDLAFPAFFRSIFHLGKYQSVSIFHGDQVILLSDRDNPSCYPAQEFVRTVKLKNNLALLAAPYVYTYLRPTIPLSTSDLEAADLQMVGFSHFPIEGRLIESMPLDGQQSLTICSHLSEQGQQVFEDFKSNKLSGRWQPVITFIAARVIQDRSFLKTPFKGLRLAFHQEFLQIDTSDPVPRFTHLYYWNKTDSHMQARNRAKHLLYQKDRDELFQDIDLSSTAISNKEELSTLSKLLLQQRRQVKTKVVRKRISSRDFLPLRRIPLRYPLIIATILLLVWTIYLENSLDRLKSYRSILNRDVVVLQSIQSELSAMAGEKRSLIRIQALTESIDQHRMHMADVLSRLDEMMPRFCWISGLEIDHSSIRLELYDASKTAHSSEALRLLGDTFKDVQLEETSPIEIDGYHFRKQVFFIHQKETDGN